MIIFQTAGSGDAEGILRGLLAAGALEERIGTFRNDSYIHRLNRTLQAEMRAVEAYSGAAKGTRKPCFYDEACARHQEAGKELVRIIIANRGLPEEKTALSVGLTGTLVRFSRRIPSPLSEKATRTTLTQVERLLVNNYRKLLKEAPAHDAARLRNLMANAERLAGDLLEL